MSLTPRIEKRGYLQVEWYLCKGNDCDGPRGTGEASIRALRVERSIGAPDIVEVTFLDGPGDEVWHVPRAVLRAMAKA